MSPSKIRKSVKIQKPNRTIKNLISNYNTDVMNFLASGRTYSMYDRKRINFKHVTKDVAEQNTVENLDKEKSRKLKPKVNHGKFKKYEFDKDAFFLYQKLSYNQQKRLITGPNWWVNTTLLIKQTDQEF